MVYVLNENGQPLMPTENHAKVRVLLKQGKAKVVNNCPFTIQLLYSSTNYTQPVTLGVDAGSKHIGLSATTEDKELYAADVELRNDISNLLFVGFNIYAAIFASYTMFFIVIPICFNKI